MAQYIPEPDQNSIEDKPLYPQMSVEKAPRFKHRQVMTIILVPTLMLILLNISVYLYLQNDWLDRGQAIVRVKWQMLDDIDTPADYIILGDSSANQGFNPQHVTEYSDLDGINLATIGVWGIVDDVWLLQTYIDRYGVPETVIVLHTFDVVQRDVNLNVGLGTYQIPINTIDDLPFAQSLSLADKIQIYHRRLVPISSRQTTLQNILGKVTSEGFAAFTPNYEFNASGYQTWDVATPDVVYRQFEELPNLFMEGEITTEFSEINLEAINILIDMAVEHNFQLYFGKGPVYEEAINYPPYVTLQAELDATYNALVAPHENVHYLPDLVPFPATQMEGVDHITTDATPRYTLQVADWIWDICDDTNNQCDDALTANPSPDQ